MIFVPTTCQRFGCTQQKLHQAPLLTLCSRRRAAKAASHIFISVITRAGSTGVPIMHGSRNNNNNNNAHWLQRRTRLCLCVMDGWKMEISPSLTWTWTPASPETTVYFFFILSAVCSSTYVTIMCPSPVLPSTEKINKVVFFYRDTLPHNIYILKKQIYFSSSSNCLKIKKNK